MDQNYIWLFGENLGASSSNNAYYLWKEVVTKKDGIDKYIVFEKNDVNKRTYNQLNDEERKFVVWKNSLKHFKLFLNADMYWVILSFRDITPTRVLGYPVDFSIDKPLIYLQHGTLAIKQIDYKGWSYNNNFFRFFYYNKNIKETFMERNDFKEYQLYYAKYMPRYKELVKRHMNYQKQKSEKNETGKKFLWFLTWREYLGENYMTDILMLQMKNLLTNPELAEYLERTGSTFTVCLHQFFSEDKIADVKEAVSTDRIIFTHSNKVDVLDELASSDVLITDYSSVGFDFTVLQKPVILFQPDRKAYLAKRKLYCTMEELEVASYTKPREVVDSIINETYSVNDFFRKNLPEDIDYDYIMEGKHIERMYNEFAEIQKNKITFLGYNFYGIGGTVYATRSLAEALMEKNYMVELMSLKCTCKPKNMPYALQLTPMYKSNSRRKIERLKRGVFKFLTNFYGYLEYDCSKQHLSPYAGYALRKQMKKIKSKTVISTRETLHLFLNDATSEKIENKVYFFHAAAELVEGLFPTVMDKIKKIGVGKAVFVTEENRKLFKELCGFDNYKDYIVLGNTLESSRSVSKEEIISQNDDVAEHTTVTNQVQEETKEEGFKGIYLVRISHERAPDIENLIGFAKFLKEKKVTGIVIDVYGAGDYLDEFISRVYNEELEDYICYCGQTNNPKAEFAKHDAVVDFTLNHSFGMPYIEAVLNGKMVFCTDNTGSREVLANVDGCIYNSYEDLLNKINHFDEITPEQLAANYDEVSKVYYRDVLANNFIDFINKK